MPSVLVSLLLASWKDESKTYRRSTSVKVVQVPIQCVAVELHSYDFLRYRIGDAERLLEALQHAFAVLVWILQGPH